MTNAGRKRLSECVAELLDAIDYGVVEPEVAELAALQFLCYREELPTEGHALITLMEKVLEKPLRQPT